MLLDDRLVREGRTIQRIREAVAEGTLTEPFSAADIKRLLSISYANGFLSDHRVGNPKGVTELFIQVSHRPALFRLVPKEKSAGKGAGA